MPGMKGVLKIPRNNDLGA